MNRGPLEEAAVAAQTGQAAPRASGSATLARYLAQSQRSWATRRLPIERIDVIEPEAWHPRPGDLCCVRVEQIGAPSDVVLADGSVVPLRERSNLWMLFDGEPGAGAAVGAVIGAHVVRHVSGVFGACGRAQAATATLVRPLAVALRGEGRACNARQGALALPAWLAQVPPVLIVMPAHAGVAFDGVLQAAARLVNASGDAGLRIGALQLAGAGPEPGMAKLAAAGAAVSLDLCDVGVCSTTHSSRAQLQHAFLHQLNLLAHARVDLVLACAAEHALAGVMPMLLDAKPVKRALHGVCLVEDVQDRRPPVASSAFAALDVPLVISTVGSATQPPTRGLSSASAPTAPRDDLHELAALLGDLGMRDFEVTRPSWWLAEE